MEHISEAPKWWKYLGKFLLIATIAAVIICFIGFWSLKSGDFAQYFVGIFGHDSLGQAIGIAVMHTFSLYAILILLIIAVVGILLGVYLRLPLKDFVIVFVVSLISVLYIMAFS
jgi:hypothetical protein